VTGRQLPYLLSRQTQKEKVALALVSFVVESFLYPKGGQIVASVVWAEIQLKTGLWLSKIFWKVRVNVIFASNRNNLKPRGEPYNNVRMSVSRQKKPESPLLTGISAD
jgi:hypothetical protein